MYLWRCHVSWLKKFEWYSRCKNKRKPSPPKKKNKTQNKFSCLNEPLFFIKCFNWNELLYMKFSNNKICHAGCPVIPCAETSSSTSVNSSAWFKIWILVLLCQIVTALFKVSINLQGISQFITFLLLSWGRTWIPEMGVSCALLCRTVIYRSANETLLVLSVTELRFVSFLHASG